jgi:hypothetical protein
MLLTHEYKQTFTRTQYAYVEELYLLGYRAA